VIRGAVFRVLSAVLLFSALLLALEAVFSSGVYGCAPPLTLVFLCPLTVCGVLCLALARGQSERIAVAVVVAIGALASVRLLSFDFGYPPGYEPGAIGDARTVVSAETTYQFANGGYYDTLECLARPSSCIPGYPANGPTFVDAHLDGPQTSRRYRRWLVPGPSVPNVPPTVSRTSMQRFAFVAVPVDSRSRSFCADDTGVVQQAPNGITPNVRDGRCDDPRFAPLK
jgi:hypothetical protein